MLTPEQIEQRLSYITGSDASVICGVNQYMTPYQLWLYKTRREVAPDISDNPYVKAGILLENAVANWFAVETGKDLSFCDNLQVHKDFPILAGNIDRKIWGENAILECKTTQSDKGWGLGYEHGDNKIPDQHLCQVIHYCAVADADVAYVAVLIRGIDFRWFKYERDRELEEDIIRRELHFWNEYVMADKPPEPLTEKEVLQLLDGKVSSESICANGEIQQALDELRVTREQIDYLESIEKTLRDKICVYMGEHQTLLNLDGTMALTYKKHKGATTFDMEKFTEAYPKTYAKFLTTGKEKRYFKLIRAKK